MEAFVLNYIVETEGRMMDDLLSRDASHELHFSETMQVWERWRSEQQTRVMALGETEHERRSRIAS